MGSFPLSHNHIGAHQSDHVPARHALDTPTDALRLLPVTPLPPAVGQFLSTRPMRLIPGEGARIRQ